MSNLTSLEAALALVRAQARSFGTEYISLDEALGRVLAENVFADRDYPPFNRATMDGFALRHADWQAGLREFLVLDTVWPGKAADLAIQPGSCFKIMTGAPVPEGASLVIRKEDLDPANREDEPGKAQSVRFIDREHLAGEYIASKGKDLQAGSIIQLKDRRLGSVEISVLAALGKSHVEVMKLPHVCCFTSGNEVRELNEAVSPWEIRNSNKYLLQGLLGHWGIQAQHAAHVKDIRADWTKALELTTGSDLLIFNGAVSAGEADFVPDVLEEAGMEVIFKQAAIRPGKPLLFGKFSAGPTVFALPGNPYSCLVGFRIFIDAFLRQSLNLPLEREEVYLEGNRMKSHSLSEFLPAGPGSAPGTVRLLAFNGSGDIRACMGASGLVLQEERQTIIQTGDRLSYYPLYNLT